MVSAYCEPKNELESCWHFSTLNETRFWLKKQMTETANIEKLGPIIKWFINNKRVSEFKPASADRLLSHVLGTNDRLFELGSTVICKKVKSRLPRIFDVAHLLYHTSFRYPF